MKWTEDAEAAVKKVPFFVRKRVRARVENDAAAAGKQVVSLADVKASQARFLSKMNSEIKGYQLDTCFGPSGCPNRANTGDHLIERLEILLKEADILGFLKDQVKGDLKFHHEFRVTLAECPNACSQPQIKDVGIIAACVPALSHEQCTLCNACVEACKEDAIQLDEVNEKPLVNFERCLACGQCMAVCPTGTIVSGEKGFRVQLGGKLGRHPRLALELPGIFSEDEVVAIVGACVQFYKKTSRGGSRFADILTNSEFAKIANRFRSSQQRTARNG